MRIYKGLAVGAEQTANSATVSASSIFSIATRTSTMALRALPRTSCWRHAGFLTQAERRSVRCVSTTRPSPAEAVSSTSSTADQPPLAAHEAAKREGDISDAFASLSGLTFRPLEPRFASIKKQLLDGREDALHASWVRLLQALRDETAAIATYGSDIVPEIAYSDIHSNNEAFAAALRKRGVAVVRNVLPSDDALALKQSLREYIAANPSTRAFPPTNPQVYELYWSEAQMRARLHPRLLEAQRFLMSFWHDHSGTAPVSLAHPTAYADRLRMRSPGDNQFALGPHVDGGSCERWEAEGYGRGGVYDKVFEGRWEELDSWDVAARLPVVSDLYGGVGACSAFRAFQGWLSMSETGPREGTLLVNPLLKHASAYYLLRPFFEPVRNSNPDDEDFLDASNWRLQTEPDSWLQGATPGHGQELRDHLHPHLRLDRTMVHAPRVQPGDYVAWHCDTIHSVDSVHQGTADSSVLYIPACPLTGSNAHHLRRQRDNFMRGVPSPDFPGGVGESAHLGRVTAETVREWVQDGRDGFDEESLRAWGLAPYDSTAAGLSSGQRQVMDMANRRLGFQV